MQDIRTRLVEVVLSKCFLKFLIVFTSLTGCSTAPVPDFTPPVQNRAEVTADPAELYAELFEKVQTAPVFTDSKYFVDMTPRQPPAEIVKSYRAEQPQTIAQLKTFVQNHFSPPDTTPSVPENTARAATVDLHIQSLWKDLTRSPDKDTESASSLVPLPYSYVVPGGRFREIYYWDSYFTQLGLLADNQESLFRNMVLNFDYLLKAYGRIPNGNRDYYLGRSQPPFFSLMVSLWRDRFGDQSALSFIPALRKEYTFWMQGSRAVAVAGNRTLNRYWDDKAGPRPEAYKEDLKLANEASTLLKRPSAEVFRELRAGAESGWDFSTRWFANPKEFASIQTTSFAPIDLNSLLYFLETTLADLYAVSGDKASSGQFRTLATQRRLLIHELMWDEATGTFRDYNWRSQTRSPEITAAMLAALFTGVATPEQAKRMAPVIERQFLKPGGIVTTLRRSGQQWDAPNGWPPHQWMAYAGLKRYGYSALAEKIRTRWLKLNEKVYRATGKMMEKYNVTDLTLKAGGGEYPLQDGFGWTNGVYRALRTPETSLKHLGL